VSVVYTDNPDQDEWYNACTGGRSGTGSGGAQKYPYSDTYDASVCNGTDYEAGATIAVGSAAGCVGSAPSLFDMSGNVAEWQNSCNEAVGDAGTCEARGGGFRSDAGGLTCQALLPNGRAYSAPDIGIRCCSN
jgi:formylglycine-generating enzyme